MNYLIGIGIIVLLYFSLCILWNTEQTNEKLDYIVKQNDHIINLEYQNSLTISSTFTNE